MCHQAEPFAFYRVKKERGKHHTTDTKKEEEEEEEEEEEDWDHTERWKVEVGRKFRI